MEVISLALPPTLRSKLLSAGFVTTGDLQGVGPIELAKDASISHEEALSILKLVPRARWTSTTTTGDTAVAGAKSAWQLLELEKGRKRILTSCQELDRILGGGICPQEVTEICGVPGVGKTQLGIQLSINVQLPLEVGGLSGEAVYIDTEGSFMVERALEISKAWINDLHKQAASQEFESVRQSFATMTPSDVLSSIYYFRIYDYVEQLGLINALHDFLTEHVKVKLVVIDSVTFHFRQDFDDMAQRSRLLSGMAQKLMAISDQHDLAVVLINQVTTKVNGEKSKLVPALGESWSHACTNRIILYWADGKRFAHIYKSPSLRAATAQFAVSADGIRDASDANKRVRPDALDGAE
eukprot:SM000127S26636  [mRNA]  locus=s127:144054:146389:- [translate_table: standard]